jgi:hypothetical protein
LGIAHGVVRSDVMSDLGHLALAFGAIGRLYAIKRALDYDLREAKRARPDVVVPREVFEALMRGWYLALGMDAALATHDWDATTRG